MSSIIRGITQAIELDPEDALAHYNRGVARAEKGDLEGGIEDFTQAIKFEPNNYSAFLNRGLAKRSNGDSDGAIADYTRAEARN